MKLFTATRKVMTCTIRKLQVKLFAKYKMNVSTGTIFKLKPFFISFPTEKEKILCMCKLCLNLHMKFDCIMEHTKNENGKVFTFMSNFYMDNCTCNKSELWYWSFDCCNGSCDSCKNINLPEIRSFPNETLVKYFPFELVESEYESRKTLVFLLLYSLSTSSNRKYFTKVSFERLCTSGKLIFLQESKEPLSKDQHPTSYWMYNYPCKSCS